MSIIANDFASEEKEATGKKYLAAVWAEAKALYDADQVTLEKAFEIIEDAVRETIEHKK